LKIKEHDEEAEIWELYKAGKPFKLQTPWYDEGNQTICKNVASAELAFRTARLPGYPCSFRCETVLTPYLSCIVEVCAEDTERGTALG
jgi:hypothetical protein